MADTKPENPLAFPRAGFHPGELTLGNMRTCTQPEEGMTLRDYFAAHAMAALISRGAFEDEHAEEAFKTADAMLAARKE